jgi:hypothetical protein
MHSSPLKGTTVGEKVPDLFRELKRFLRVIEAWDFILPLLSPPPLSEGWISALKSPVAFPKPRTLHF